ncbi:unnamed protein product [Ranitomeya imitator]|uniref:WH2 domain-containing protein n=1 Tax=Ranitomeya imitator TaxID=111125 RepID=A0ABN9MCP8_9NEOB|nr:unnamed protein product [Ranitomeya imitator]
MANKVRLRRSRSVKTRRGRHPMKMGGAGTDCYAHRTGPQRDRPWANNGSAAATRDPGKEDINYRQRDIAESRSMHVLQRTASCLMPSSINLDSRLRLQAIPLLYLLQFRSHTKRNCRRGSGTARQEVSTLQINVSSSPTHCQSPPPDYNNYRTSPSAGTIPPPSYAKAISSASPVPEPSNISTQKSSNRSNDSPELPSNSLSGLESSASQASAFSPIWPSNGTLSRSVKQISLSPPPPNSHSPLTSHQSVKHPSVSFSSRSSSPSVALPVLHQNVSPQLPIPATLPVIPAQNVRSRGVLDKMVQNSNLPHQIGPDDQADEPHSTQIPLSSQKAKVKSYDRSFLSCLETVPLPQLPVIASPAGTLTHASAQPFHTSCQPSQPSYQSTSHFVSLPPPYAAVSELNLSKRTTHYMTSAISQLSPMVPPGHLSTTTMVASVGVVPAPSSGPPPPPPPVPLPPSGATPPPAPPLPAGGSQGVVYEDSPASGLAAALAGAKLRKVQRPEDGSGSSSPCGASKTDANRTSSGSGGGGLMEEMNKLLAKRFSTLRISDALKGRKAASQTEKPGDKKEDECQNEDASLSSSPNTRGPTPQNSAAGISPRSRQFILAGKATSVTGANLDDVTAGH